jgi:anterior pharynx defective protein 1
MGFAAFAGPLLLGAGPLAVLVFAAVARQSFLLLLFLGSAFYWLTTLFVISAAFRAFAPLTPAAGAYAALVAVAVGVQELARLALWRWAHVPALRALRAAARGRRRPAGAPSPGVTASDELAMAVTHGAAHATVHALFFFVAWLPLALDDGTLYAAACPQMSFYLAGALLTLGFSALLTGASVLAFDALARGAPARWEAAAPAALHAAAAFSTLASFAPGGCVGAAAAALALGAGAAAAAGRVWWARTGPPPRRAAAAD